MKIKITSAKLKNSEFQDTIIESLILEINGVKWGVPKDPDNQMYQAYLDWVAEGNTAEAAD